MALADLPECWQEFLAQCCFLCTRDVNAPESGLQTYLTIQNVSGCPCLDGATFFPTTELYDASTAFCPGTSSFAWLFNELGPQCITPPVADFFDHMVLACCETADPYMYIDFQYGHGASAITVLASSPAGLLGFYTELTIVSFSTSPFELILEADVFSSSGSCNPGRLRFIFTRA